MSPQRELLLDTCLLAGRIMLENGSEVYRVEDTMLRIAKNADEEQATCYITITGIFMGFKHHYTQMANIRERGYDLEKVAAVNQLSRAFANQEIDLTELQIALEKVDRETPTFPFWLQLLCAGTVSATLMFVFLSNSWINFIPTFFIGMLGFFVCEWVSRHSEVLFFNIFLAAVIIGCTTIGLTKIFPALDVDSIIIGSVMPLVPGVAITNSFRDILAGHLISGLTRGTEAMIVATAIGVGIATALLFLGGVIH